MCCSETSGADVDHARHHSTASGEACCESNATGELPLACTIGLFGAALAIAIVADATPVTKTAGVTAALSGVALVSTG